MPKNKWKKILHSKCRNKRLQCYDWRKNFFDEPIKDIKVTYENIRKIATGQGDDYTTGCLLDYTYFKKYYKMIAIDLSKEQVLHADPKAIQQISFPANLNREGNTRFYFILEEAKKLFLNFHKEP